MKALLCVAILVGLIGVCLNAVAMFTPVELMLGLIWLKLVSMDKKRE